MKSSNSWSYTEKAEFLIRIGTLIEQGYTIPEAIELFLKYEKEKLKPTLTTMLEKLQKGNSFSEALVLIQIPKNIVSFVYFAEYYGDLARGLIDGGELLKKTQETKTNFQKLMKYPLFLLWLLLLFLGIMYHYLFPQFTELFTSINIELPLVTRVVLTLIDKSPYILPLCLSFLLILYIYYLFSFRKKDIVNQAQIYSKIPLIGHYYSAMTTYFFAMNLSCLIKNGLAIYDALDIFKKVDGLGYISKEAENITSQLEAGEKLHHVLIKDTLFLKGLAYIVEHGQANGRLDEELEHYSSWLLNDLEEKIKKLLMIIQPILFLLLGLIILLLFSSILVPVFSLISGF